jgi:hypothetical protein
MCTPDCRRRHSMPRAIAARGGPRELPDRADRNPPRGAWSRVDRVHRGRTAATARVYAPSRKRSHEKRQHPLRLAANRARRDLLAQGQRLPRRSQWRRVTRQFHAEFSRHGRGADREPMVPQRRGQASGIRRRSRGGISHAASKGRFAKSLAAAIFARISRTFLFSALRQASRAILRAFDARRRVSSSMRRMSIRRSDGVREGIRPGCAKPPHPALAVKQCFAVTTDRVAGVNFRRADEARHSGAGSMLDSAVGPKRDVDARDDGASTPYATRELSHSVSSNTASYALERAGQPGAVTALSQRMLSALAEDRENLLTEPVVVHRLAKNPDERRVSILQRRDQCSR